MGKGWRFDGFVLESSVEWNFFFHRFFFFPDPSRSKNPRTSSIRASPRPESVHEISLKSAIRVLYARSVRKNRLFPPKITFHERLEKEREREREGEGERVSYRWLAKKAGKKLMKPRESSSSLFTFDREVRWNVTGGKGSIIVNTRRGAEQSKIHIVIRYDFSDWFYWSRLKDRTTRSWIANLSFQQIVRADTIRNSEWRVTRQRFRWRRKKKKKKEGEEWCMKTYSGTGKLMSCAPTKLSNEL